MPSILEEFAHDNLTSEPQASWKKPEYKELVSLVNRNKEKLLARLNEEEKEMLEKYTDAQLEQHAIENNDRFIHGFKMGLILTAEAFVTGGDLTEDA